MKRSTLMRIALVVTALFMFSGVFAQILTDYTVTNQSGSEPTMYQTKGTNFRLYVSPDPVYSPSYDPATNENVNSGSYWKFTITSGLTAVSPGDLSSAVNQNWVELNATTAGTQTVTAAEQWGASGCSDVTPESLTVEVVNPPVAEITTADPAVRCTDATGLGTDNVTVTIVENVPSSLAKYAFAVTETVYNWDDVNGTNPTTITATATKYDYKISSKQAATGASSPYSITFATSNLAVQNGKVTVYEYELKKSSDAPVSAADGIVSVVSHRSDYLTIKASNPLTVYPFGDTNSDSSTKTKYTAIVAPTPTTGPIYHIPNSFYN